MTRDADWEVVLWLVLVAIVFALLAGQPRL